MASALGAAWLGPKTASRDLALAPNFQPQLTVPATLHAADVVRADPYVAASASTLTSLAAATAVGAAIGAATSRRRRRRAERPAVSRVVPQAAAPVVAAMPDTLCHDSDAPESMRRRFEAVVAAAQQRICSLVEAADGQAKFSTERYTREGGGGGIARVLKDGAVFEKAGVNLSVVYGQMPQEALAAATERGANRAGKPLAPGEKVPFFACGLSSVLHPKNPHCPTMHFNYRYFETETGVWWFGGGTDITPAYLDEADMRHFHGTYKEVCDRHDPEWYPKFKAWADRYFVIPHRGETRGLGGIFFDDFNEEDPAKHLQFAEDCLQAVPQAYLPIIEKNRDLAFTEEQKAWQLMRRGRYVEFNLVYDRGTIFGLKMLPSGTGRIESILMSLPETARWEYNHVPEQGSPEHEIMELFKSPRDWV